MKTNRGVLGDLEIAEIVALGKSGVSVQRISVRVKRSPDAIRSILKGNAVTPVGMKEIRYRTGLKSRSKV